MTPIDQVLGTGDGATTAFQLVKRYESGAQAWVRRIVKPVAGTVRVARGGVEAVSGWSVERHDRRRHLRRRARRRRPRHRRLRVRRAGALRHRPARRHLGPRPARLDRLDPARGGAAMIAPPSSAQLSSVQFSSVQFRFSSVQFRRQPPGTRRVSSRLQPVVGVTGVDRPVGVKHQPLDRAQPPLRSRARQGRARKIRAQRQLEEIEAVFLVGDGAPQRGGDIRLTRRGDAERRRRRCGSRGRRPAAVTSSTSFGMASR